jgi:acetyltransferase-like isoleucine patch superfamily enzyme
MVHIVRKFLASVRRDLAVAAVTTFRETIAGSVLVPQVIRTWLYRASGMWDVRSYNIRPRQVLDNSNLRIGDRAAVNQGCFFEGKGLIALGEDCRIGPQTMFITSLHMRLPDGTLEADSTYREIHVGRRAWVGARAVILPGAVIEEDCVIAAGSVVRGRCVAGLTYGGVPARRISTAWDIRRDSDVPVPP